MYVYRRLNDGFKSVFDANQHPEVHLAGNGNSVAQICKEITDFSRTSSDIFYCKTI